LAYFYKGDTKLTEQEQLDILNNISDGKNEH
jgi:hypothetical protein